MPHVKLTLWIKKYTFVNEMVAKLFYGAYYFDNLLYKGLMKYVPPPYLYISHPYGYDKFMSAPF